MQKKKILKSTGMALVIVLLASLLYIFTFRTINKVFFDAAADQSMQLMEVIRDLGVHMVEDNLQDLKANLERAADKYSDQLTSDTPGVALSKLPVPQDGIDYFIAEPDGSEIDSKGGKNSWKKELDLKAVFSSGKTTVLEPYFNKDKKYILSIAAPLRENGKITSLLVLRLDGFCISNWLKTIQFSTGEGVAYIIASDGRNIAASREENYDWITSKYNSQKIAGTSEESATVAELERRPLDGKTGRGSYLWEGSRNYLVYAPMKDTGWGFFVGFYGDLIKDYIKKSAVKSITSSIPFFLVVLLFFASVAIYANYNYRKERGYVKELIFQKKEIEKQAEALTVNEERFRVALAQTSNTIFEYDPATGSITNFYATKVVTEILDFKEGIEHHIISTGTIDEESLARLRNIFNDTRKGIYDNECMIKVDCPDHTVVWYKVSISPLSGQQSRVIGIVEDITKEKLAELDPLTGLLNKKIIKEQISDYLQNRSRLELFAFLMIDIDDFKNVNDICGHPAGDQVIIQTGHILKEIFPANALIGRVGGDEFCIFCSLLTSPQELEEHLNTFYSHTIQTCKEVSVTYSTGIALCSGKEDITFEEMYKRSDIALYKAKMQGKNQYCFE